MLPLLLLLLALAAPLASGSGGTLAVHEDFHNFGNRRGGGGGARGFLSTNTLRDSSGNSVFSNWRNYGQPSVGWRSVTEHMNSIQNGVANFWIGEFASTSTLWKLPELIQMRRTQSSGTSDAGPMWLPASSSSTTPSVAGMCSGAYHGVHNLAEKYGVVRDFTQLSVRVAGWNPGTLSGGIGLTFSFVQSYSSTSGGASGLTYGFVTTQYVAMFRGRAGGVELCAGVYKMVNGKNVPITGQSTTITAMSAFSNTANPARSTTSLASRQYSRLGVSRSGNVIKLWIDNSTNVVHTVTDSVAPLGAGQVGVTAVGMNTVIYDDFTLIDAPTCSDGIWNGEEEGVDCGGASQSGPCPACAASETYTHSFISGSNSYQTTNDGLSGLDSEVYATSGTPRWPMFMSNSMYWATNCAYDWPGSSGLNIQSWGGAWFLLAPKWPQAKDIDFKVHNAASDNDRQGVVWRFVDHNNYYSFEARSETRPEGHPLVVHRRRNGINTRVYEQVNMEPQPHDHTIEHYFQVQMTGDTIKIYTNRNGGTAMVLIATIVDTDPLDEPGYVGLIGNYQSPAYNLYMTYTVHRSTATLPNLPTGLNQLTVAGQQALGVYVDPTPSDSESKLYGLRAMSATGYGMAGSPFYVGTSVIPAADANLSPLGTAIVFSGAQALWSASRLVGDPAITGMAVLVAFIPTGTVSAGAAGVVLSKGLRERPYPPDASGWRLQVVNTADRAIPSSSATQAVQFVAQTNVLGSPSVSVDLAHPIALDGSVYVAAIRVMPSTVKTGSLSARTFLVNASLNGAVFSHSISDSFVGVLSSSIDAHLAMGGTNTVTDGFTGAVFETLVFRTSLTDADWAAAQRYMLNKYVNTPATCPDISASQANTVVVSGTCTGAANGDVCTLGCAAGATQSAGSGSLVCRSGKWMGAFPSCELTCPALTAVGTGLSGCRSMLNNDAFRLPGKVGQASTTAEYRHWRILPAAANNWEVSTPGVLTVSPAPGQRFIFPLFALANNPAWASRTAAIAITQVIRVPTSPKPPLVLSAIPRYVDSKNYYSVDVVYDAGVTTKQTLRLVRVKNGASATICSQSLTLLPGSTQRFEAEMTLVSGGSGTMKMSRNGAIWCGLQESSSLYISSGSSGYSVQGLDGFTGLAFGPQTVEALDQPCPLGCNGVVANGTCTLPCNPGTVARGDNVRTCFQNGTSGMAWSGAPLVCDNGAPAISDVTVSQPENQPVNSAVGLPFPSVLVSGKDGAGTIVFQIVSGNGNAAFSIDSCTGQVRVADPALIDFERLNPGSADTFSLGIRAFIAGSSPVAESFAKMDITVTDTNDAPVLSSRNCTVNENSQQGSPVCLLSVVDPDGGSQAIFAWTFEEVPGLFSLDAASGAITVGDVGKLGALNFESKALFRQMVKLTDAADPSVSSTYPLPVLVLNQPEPPSVRADCAVDVDASLMASANSPVPNFNAITDCVVDEDAGSSVTALSAAVLSNPLVTIQSSGAASTFISKTYTGVAPYLRAGRLIVDYGTMSISVTDDTGLQSTGTANVYVLANVSTADPVIRGVQVTAMTSASGSGFVKGEYLLNTDGQDSVLFVGDNMLYDTAHVLSATVTATATTRSWTVTCKYRYTGAVSGTKPLADGIECPTSAGWGRNWAWSLTLASDGTPVPILSTVSLVTHYAPPIVTAIGPKGGNGQAMDCPTAGGTDVELSGYNLGASGTPITVDFGIENAADGSVAWSNDAVAGLSATHTSAIGSTRPGAGTDLYLRVTVGGQVVLVPGAVRMSYNVPTIASISRVGRVSLLYGAAAPPPAVPTIRGVRTLRAGQTIIVRGTNLGPSTLTGMKLMFGLPGVHPDNNMPWVADNCFYPSSSTSHTLMHCIAPAAGSGTYTAIVQIANQMSARTSSAVLAETVQYHTAHVSSVTGPGARLADTRGGQLVYFSGSNFGPRWAVQSGVCSAPKAWYGMTNTTGLPYNVGVRNLKYSMANCEVMDDAGTLIVCSMVEGTGYRPPFWRWTVVGCNDHGWTGVLGAIRYAPPIVTNFDDGGVSSDTRGGSSVSIFGRNFGPSMEFVEVRYFSPVTGVDGAVREVAYTPTGCTKPDAARAHELIVCQTQAGAGSQLRWEVVVESQVSVQPTSQYKQPVISYLSMSSSADIAVTAAAGSGGTVIYIKGSQFGPAAAGSLGRDLIQSVSIGPSSDPELAYLIPPADITFEVPQSMIRVKLPPGIGQNLELKLKIADVEVSPAAGAPGSTISYAAPRVVSISPAAFPTRGAVTARVFIKNAGLLDPTALIAIAINGVSVPVVARFPTLERVLAASARDAPVALSAVEADDDNHYADITVPEGAGAGLPVVVSASRAGNSTGVSSDAVLDGASSWLAYSAAAIKLVAADRLPADLVTNLTAGMTPQQASEIDGWRVLTILGSNFGPAQLYGMVEMMAVDTAGVPIDTAWRSGSDVVYDLMSWQHERIVIVVKLTQAAVRVSIQTIDPSASSPVFGSGPLLSSNTFTYLDVAPAVLGITGVDPSGYNTAADPPQTVTMLLKYVGSFQTLEVRVGNSTAPFLASDMVTVVPPGDVMTQLIAPQIAAQAGTPANDMTFRITVRVPEGEGAQVPIVVVRDGTPGTGSDTLSYMRPVVSSLTVDAGLPQSSESATVTAPLRVSTEGGFVLLQGSNFGLCPAIVFGGLSVRSCGTSSAAGTLRVVTSNHTHLLAELPAGTGAGTPSGYSLGIVVGAPNGVDQTQEQSMFAAYALPTVTSVLPAVSSTGLPTEGGVEILLQGSNFGPAAAAVPVVVFHMMTVNGTNSASCLDVARDVATPHALLRCMLPAGSGANIDMSVTVGDQTGTTPGAFSFDAPTVTQVSNLAHPTGAAEGAAFGNYSVVITGANFGPARLAGHCVFLPSATVLDSSLICNSAADSWEEYELPGYTIQSWSHRQIVVNMVAGIGARVVRVATPGAITDASTLSAVSFTYSAPVITAVDPMTSDTSADRSTSRTRLITLTGVNFGFGSITSQNQARLRTDVPYTPLTPQLPSPGHVGRPLSSRNWPSDFALRVNFFNGSRCITSAVASDMKDTNVVNGGNIRPAAVAECKNDESTYSAIAGVTAHSDSAVSFYALPGVGKDRLISVTIVGPDGAEITSNGWPFSYTPPAVTSVVGLGLMKAPEPFTGNADATLSTWEYRGQTAQILGTNFGPSDAATRAEMTAEERAVSILVGGTACAEPVAVEGGFECQFTASDVPLSSQAMPKVGYRRVSGAIAGQSIMPQTAYDLVHLTCAAGFYGYPGEVCDVCPLNALCEGYMSSRTGAAQAEDGRPAMLSRVNEDNLNVTECLACYAQPRALAGFYNMRGKLNGQGESESLCSEVRQAEGKQAITCNYVVACSPPEACLDNNVCSDGYADTGFPYRCSFCAAGYFRSFDSCQKCPETPELNILFFFLAAIVGIGAAYFLNQKQINIAFLTIGLDYLQVVSIFANTRVNWPPQIKELFRILSAFNLNIEIVAPECVFKGISYGEKWSAIMLLPVAVTSLLLCFHATAAVWTVVIRGQSKRHLAAQASPLLAMAQVLMYFLYLYITRSIFDVMTCRGNVPAEYDLSGKEILYMGSTLFKCGEKGGVQEQLLPAAIAALSFYTVGYPAFIGYNLYNNRELVMQDQLLRAKRVGDDKMSNPQGYEFRRRWSRAYYQFRPDMCMWVLAIILRKFCIAIASLIFNTNQNFQMAAMLLVLFVAYAAQVRFLPYMGPATFDAVLKDHEEQARMGDATHLKLAATLAGIETKGRKRTRGNTFNTMKSMDGKALASAFAAFLFDYNTVEAVLIASALLVALAGVMFGAIDGSPSSAFYRDSRDGVMASVLILISFSIVYWLTVVVVEISMIVHERSDTAKAVAASRKQAAAGKGKKKTSRGQDNDEEEETLRDDFDTGVIENANNPLFLQVKTSGGSTELDATAVRSMLVVPSESVWHVLRSTYVSTAEHIAAMEDEAARLRAELAGVTVAAVKRSSRTLPATSARGGTASGSLPPPSPLLSASRSDSDDNARASLDPVKRAKSMGLHIKAGEGGVT